MIEISINADEPSKIEKDTFIKAFETALQNTVTDKVQPRQPFENLSVYEPDEWLENYANGGYIL